MSDQSEIRTTDPTMIWTGWIKKGELPGTIVGELKDSWGWPIAIAGTLDKEGGGYVLQGRLGKVPDNLHIEAIDDAPDKAGQHQGDTV
jgi:hypothetical protein